MQTSATRSMLVVLALAASTSAATVWAETGTDKTEDVSVQGSTPDFVKSAGNANLFEVQSGRLALEKSANPKVKEFARMMVSDHGKSGDALKAAVKDANAGTEVPTELDADHQLKLEKLQTADAKDFDEMYVNIMQDGHRKALELFSEYSKSGENSELKKYAATTLPTLQMHKEHVNKLEDSIH